jgi:hypothetical protein
VRRARQGRRRTWRASQRGVPARSWFNHWKITAGRPPVPTPKPPEWMPHQIGHVLREVPGSGSPSWSHLYHARARFASFAGMRDVAMRLIPLQDVETAIWPGGDVSCDHRVATYSACRKRRSSRNPSQPVNLPPTTRAVHSISGNLGPPALAVGSGNSGQLVPDATAVRTSGTQAFWSAPRDSVHQPAQDGP